MFILISTPIALLIVIILLLKNRNKATYGNIIFYFISAIFSGLLIGLIISAFIPLNTNTKVYSYDLIPIDDNTGIDSIKYMILDNSDSCSKCIYYIEDNDVIKKGIVNYNYVIINHVDTKPKVIVTETNITDNIVNLFVDDESTNNNKTYVFEIPR